MREKLKVAMFTTMINGFTANAEPRSEKLDNEGPHNSANKRLKGEISNVARRVRVWRNPRDRTLPKKGKHHHSNVG